jgi:hypothetical protein
MKIHDHELAQRTCQQSRKDARWLIDRVIVKFPDQPISLASYEQLAEFGQIWPEAGLSCGVNMPDVPRFPRGHLCLPSSAAHDSSMAQTLAAEDGKP